MTYQEVVEEIQGKRRFGTLAGARISRRMLRMLGEPQQGMKLIHIAGTNGKGSVSAFLCEILKAAGIKTGMFTSPHLVEFEERIRVNGRMIGQESVRRIGEALLSMDVSVQPTMFDYAFAMALLYFKEQQCEAAVIETGLGGRLDSTNAVETPAVSVITTIGYDHVEVLGNTLEEIAAEKAGILKEGTAFVTESQAPEALHVLLKAAERAGVSSCDLTDCGAIYDRRMENGEQHFSFGRYEDLSMRMLGLHQYENAAAAILAAERFFEKTDTGRSEEEIAAAIRRGIHDAVWPGRMEIIRDDPFFLVDGAHNGCGVTALRDSLAALFPGEKFHFLMGVMADKDYEAMVELLLPLAHSFTTVTVENARALKAGELAALIEKKGVPAHCAQELRDCLDGKHNDRAHKTVAFGSLYFIGEIKRLFKDYRFITDSVDYDKNDTF